MKLTQTKATIIILCLLVLLKVAIGVTLVAIACYGCTWFGLEETTSMIIAAITGIVCFLR